MAGVFVTALYSFRLVFMTFHGPERFRQVEAGHAHETSATPALPAATPAAHGGDAHGHAPAAHGAAAHASVAHGSSAHAADAHAVSTPTAHITVAATPPAAYGTAAATAAHAGDDHGHDDHHGPIEPHESPLVITLPLIALAIPSVVIGWLTAGPILFGGYFGDAIRVLEKNDVVAELGKEFQGPTQMALHGIISPVFGLAAAGVFCAWLFFLYRPQWAAAWARTLSPIRTLLINKYYFDWFNEKVLATLARGLGFTLWKAGDEVLIDGALVNGSAATVGWIGSIVRRVQSGYLYSYAFWMVIGLAVMLGWFLVRS
jgi:NADH:ubiquinone oxidoreductase subunit 5 (subunit L)/multisubunit Na+/H+ antiporter MnhA subunit